MMTYVHHTGLILDMYMVIIYLKQAGAELGQAQYKLGLVELPLTFSN